MQGVGSNFEIDFFADLKNQMRTFFPDPNEQSLNVIADHIRAIFFLMAEGIYPANEGRGYVVRRLCRRAIRHGYKMGVKEPFLADHLVYLESLLSHDFVEEFKQMDLVKEKLKAEENAFFKTLSAGVKMFEQNIPNNGKAMFDGEIAFKLHDTYGFPIDLTTSMAFERDLKVDLMRFNELMSSLKRIKSTFKSLSKAMLVVKSIGNPYVSCNLKAISPSNMALPLFGIFCSNIFTPAESVLKNAFSSAFNFSLTRSICLNSSTKS